MSNTPAPTPTCLRLWQQNLNKSRSAQEDLINSDLPKNYDIILLQEPYIDSYGNTKAKKDWRVVYPLSQLSHESPPCAVILINAKIDTNQWEHIHVPNTRDLVVIHICGDFGWLSIYDI